MKSSLLSLHLVGLLFAGPVTAFAQTDLVAPIDVCRFTDPADRAHIDRTVKDFLTTYQVPGVSIALAENDRMLLAKGFGYADREAGTIVDTNHRFRIASVSKPITAVAVMRMLEAGAFTLDSRVFGPEGIFRGKYGTSDPEILQITVRHLLEHTAGEEWTNDHDDPMFRKPDYDHDELIRWTLENYPLQNAPGSAFHYSNFGYCVLGRIVESASGKSYRDYVIGMLSKIQPTRLEIANDQKDPSAGEVTYHDPSADLPYRLPVARMDAHGGWIGTPTDVVNFLNELDGVYNLPPLLHPETLGIMTTPSRHNQYRALGWNVNRSGNIWHTGNLPGTATIAARTHDGKTWAVFCNGRGTNDGEFFTALDQLMWKIIGGIKEWP